MPKVPALYLLRLTLVGAGLLIVAPLWAQSSDPSENNEAACEALLSKPAVLSQSQTRKFKIELQAAGTVYGQGEKVDSAKLESSLYHYALTNKGELLLTPSYIGKRLATHKSLIEMYSRQTGQTAEIVAAGDLIVAFGSVAFMDNRSGNFRGGEEHLRYAEQELRKFGLVFTSRSLVEVHNPHKPNLTVKGHTPEGRAAHLFTITAREDVRKTRFGPEITALFEQMVPLLMLATGQATPEDMIAALMDGLTSDLIAQKISYKDFDPLTALMIPLQSALTADGLAFGLRRSFADKSPEAFAETAAGELRRVSAKYADQLSPELKTRLEGLADRFSRLR